MKTFVFSKFFRRHFRKILGPLRCLLLSSRVYYKHLLVAKSLAETFIAPARGKKEFFLQATVRKIANSPRVSIPRICNRPLFFFFATYLLE